METNNLSISDIAHETEVSAHTLRYYERIGLIPEVERSSHGGPRRYGPRHIRWIRFLRRLRSAGMSIRTMRKYVSLYKAGDHTLKERLALLQAHREEVAGKIEELQDHLAILEGSRRPQTAV